MFSPSVHLFKLCIFLRERIWELSSTISSSDRGSKIRGSVSGPSLISHCAVVQVVHVQGSCKAKFEVAWGANSAIVIFCVRRKIAGGVTFFLSFIFSSISFIMLNFSRFVFWKLKLGRVH